MDSTLPWAANFLQTIGAHKIGQVFKGMAADAPKADQETASSSVGSAGATREFSFIEQIPRYMMHMGLGGLMGQLASSDGVSRAAGAGIGELAGDFFVNYMAPAGSLDADNPEREKYVAKGLSFVELASLTSAAALGLDVHEVMTSAEISARNNAFEFAGKDESEELQQAAEKTLAGKVHKKIGDEVDAAVKSVGVPVDPDANDYEEICRRGPEFFARYCIERKEYQLGRTLRPEEIADTRWRAEIKYSIIYDAVNPSLATQAMRHGAQFLDNLSDLPFTMAEHMAVRMGADPAEVRGVRLLAEDALMITGAAGAARSVAKGIAKGVVKAAAKKTAQTAAGAEAAAIGAEAASGARGVPLGANQNGPLELTIYGRPENVVKASAATEARIGLKGRDYIRDMEKRSGIPISSQQREHLTDALRNRNFTKLDDKTKIAHGKEYKNKRESLISDWEKNTGNKWPTYVDNAFNKHGKKIADHGQRLQAHHIIPQNRGGPHEWWNMHPLEIKDHQQGVHLKNSILSKILKE